MYRLLDAEDNVANLHLADEGHDYGFNKRVGAYAFCAKHLNLELASIKDRAGQVDESFVRLLDETDLRVWDADHPPPAAPLSGAALLNLPTPQAAPTKTREECLASIAESPPSASTFVGGTAATDP